MGRKALADHVAYCREQVRNGAASCAELARQFGVTEKAMQACVYGHTYTHLPGAVRSPKRPPRRIRRTPLTEAQVIEIREAYAAGEKTVAEIAAKYGITRSYVVRLGRGMARTKIPGGTRDRQPLWGAGKRMVLRGERHPNARLDALCIVAIRSLARLDVQHTVIADIFDTTPENVSMIVRRRRWDHVPEMTLTPSALGHLPPRAAELLNGSNMPRAS